MNWIKVFLDWLAELVAPVTQKESPKITMPPKPKLDLDIPIDNSRPWKGICWHHSASPDKATRDWDGIRKYHTSYRVDFEIVSQEEFERRLNSGQGKVFQKPWRDVGYHAGTELVDGKPVYHWGRPLSMIGAHAGVSGVSNNFNEEYIGICCIGNYDALSPDPNLWEFNLKATRALMEAYKISKENVIGHREVFDRLNVPRQKSCPGMAWNLNLMRAEL